MSTEQAETPPEMAREKETMNEMAGKLAAYLEEQKKLFLITAEKNPPNNDVSKKRLRSAVKKNLEFIEKSFGIALNNPKLMPPMLEQAPLTKNQNDLKALRELAEELKLFSDAVNHISRNHSDSCYNDSLRIYRYLRELTRSGDKKAELLFQDLKPFFKRKKRKTREPAKKNPGREPWDSIEGEKGE